MWPFRDPKCGNVLLGRCSFQLHSAASIHVAPSVRTPRQVVILVVSQGCFQKALAAPDLLFEQNRRKVGGLQPNPMTRVAVENEAAALDHAHRQPLRLPVLIDVEDQRLACDRGLAADCDPLALAVPLHDDIAGIANDAVRRFSAAERRAAFSNSHSPAIEQVRYRRSDTIGLE